MGLSDNTSLNCTPQISFSAAAFQHRRAESWAARGNFAFPSVLKPSFTTDPELIVISSYLLIATDCDDLFISSKPLLKCTAKELPEDSEAKSDQSFGAHCIFLHKQIIFLFLIFKNHYSSQRTKKKKRKNYMKKPLFFKSNIKGSSNHPADFLVIPPRCGGFAHFTWQTHLWRGCGCHFEATHSKIPFWHSKILH